MMTRVTFGMQCLQRPATEFERRLVVGDDDTRLIDREYLAVQLIETIFAVHGLRTGNQFGRIGHVSSPTRMYHGARIGQRLHQQAGTTRVIQVDVGQKHVVDIGRIERPTIEGFEQTGNARVGAGVDERAAAVVRDEVTGVEQRSNVVRIDRCNAETKVSRARAFCRHDQAVPYCDLSAV